MSKKLISVVIMLCAIIFLIPAIAFAISLFRFLIFPREFTGWEPGPGIIFGIYMSLFMVLFLYISIGLWLRRQAARISAFIVSLIIIIVSIISIFNDFGSIVILLPIIILNFGIIYFLFLYSVGSEFKK